MPASRKIPGNKLLLEIDGTDQWCDVTNVVLEHEEADEDVTTFCEVDAGGPRQWFFTVSLISSVASTSFWRYLWEHHGETVNYVYSPEGTETATADSPHFTGQLTIKDKPSIGGEAGTTQTTEIRLDCTAEPTLDTGE